MRVRRSGFSEACGAAGRFGAGRARRLALLAGVALGLAWSAPALAAKGTVRAAEMAGFGRAIFTFDDLPKASARVSSGILIISFDQPVTLTSEKLAMELPNYVSAVRVDPDGKAMRLALIKGVKPNLMEAGEKLFVDLLPDNWKGITPSLPPDVVEDLSRRARDAEETARRLLRKKAAEETKELPFRIGTTPTFTRVVFDMPVVAPVELSRQDGRVELTFDSNLRIDAAKLKAALPPFVTGVDVQAEGGTLRVGIDLPQAQDVRGFREDEAYTIDLPLPKPPPKVAEKGKGKDAKVPKAEKGEVKLDPKGEAGAPARAPEGPSPEGPAHPVEEAKGPAVAPAPTPATPVTVPLAPYGKARPVEENQPSDLKIEVAAERGTVKLGLHVPNKVPIAVFERAGTLWIAAETNAPFDPTQVGLVAPGLVKDVDVRRQGRLSILRLGLARQPLVRAAATDAGWVVTLGDEVAGSSDTLALARDADDDGRTAVKAAFPNVGGVHWVDDPEVGDRLALVTGSIAPRGLLKPQNFVDFRALPSAHGLVIQPMSDDVAVKAGIDDVRITRDGGLALTMAQLTAPMAKSGEGPQLAVNAEAWMKAQAGDVRDRGRELMRAAADAPRRSRPEARLAVARFEVANGFGVEAMGTLDVLTSDDPELAKDRSVVILTAIAQVQANRAAEAVKMLGADALKDDPEAVLWRSYADGMLGRWPQALTGFRRSASLLNSYPEDLQGMLGVSYAQAAVEGRDYGVAQRVLEGLDQLGSEYVDKERVALLQARVAEGQGRVEEAIAGYDKLARTASRPVEAEARLRGIALALKDRSIDRNNAIAALEGLSVSWRGDEIEVQTLGLLGRLYAEDERWRDAFAMAHKANELFPESDITRSLYEETGSRFEALFLDNKADTIPRIDAIALYFDFKDFTPPGRRGDEMIRRLAERLVALDLLGEAADLLQHQVDNRLSGVAKANVATRLAIIQLMNHQPAKAFQALRDSRQSEMPSDLRRSRSLIEARALSDLSRTDLALEMLADEQGADVERLRADILWQSRRWREAGEQFERIAGDRWRSPEPLDDRSRADVLRAAIAYGLGDESLSLERLRAKYTAKMADSADAQSFAVITSPGGARASQYRELARAIASADTLGEFLTEYRKRYPDTPALPPKAPKPADAKPADAKPAADAKPPEGGEKPTAEKAPAEKHEAEKPAASADPKAAAGPG